MKLDIIFTQRELNNIIGHKHVGSVDVGVTKYVYVYRVLVEIYDKDRWFFKKRTVKMDFASADDARDLERQLNNRNNNLVEVKREVFTALKDVAVDAMKINVLKDKYKDALREVLDEHYPDK